MQEQLRHNSWMVFPSQLQFTASKVWPFPSFNCLGRKTAKTSSKRIFSDRFHSINPGPIILVDCFHCSRLMPLRLKYDASNPLAVVFKKFAEPKNRRRLRSQVCGETALNSRCRHNGGEIKRVSFSPKSSFSFIYFQTLKAGTCVNLS